MSLFELHSCMPRVRCDVLIVGRTNWGSLFWGM